MVLNKPTEYSEPVTFEDNNETTQKSPTEKLKELKSLLDDGLISQDQYDKKSSEILNLF